MSGKLNGATGDVVHELRLAAQALGRCATLLEGVPAPTVAVGPSEPFLTAKQLGAIRVIAKKAGLSRDQLVRLVRQASGKDVLTQLTRTEASLLIDKLKSMNGAA